MSRYFKVDSFDIDSIDNFNVRKVVSSELPQRIVNAFKKSSDFGDFITHADWGSRLLFVEGEIAADNREDLDTAHNSLKRRINVAEKRLEFPYQGANVTATGTLESMSTTDPQGGFMKATITFRLADPFYYSETTHTGQSSNQTSSGFDTSISNDGNIWAYAKVTITIDSLTANDADTITIAGDSSTMTISRVFTAGEVIVIDPDGFTVEVDGSAVSHQGQFPKIDPGGGNINYEDTLDARQVDVDVELNPRYL